MLSIGNKKYRNLQEQVGYNTECIQELAEAIDGITLEDKLVIIANDSGTFTDEEMTVLNGPLAFISDGSKVWLKQSETVSEFVFKAIDIVATEVGGTHFNVGGTKIVVTRATRAYATSDDVIITTYNKTQIEALLTAKASLSGASFTGAISAPSIIEDMVGYSFTKSASQGQYYDLSYVGACKNGNKITFVVAGKMNFPDTTQIYNIGNFIIPSSVGEKLYPIASNQIAFLSINAQINYVSRVIVSGVVVKNSDTNIDIRIYASGLTANTDYYFRIEQTFLLSDNLAQ